MAKLVISFSALVLWLHALLSGVLHLYLNPFKVDWQFYIYAPWVLLIPIALFYFLATDADYIISPQDKWRQDDEFEQQVIDLEYKYKDNIAALKLKTFLIALAGYFLIFGVITFILCAGLISSYAIGLYANIGYWVYLFAVPHMFLALKLIKTLFMQGGGSSGIEISRKQCPKFFMMLKRIQEKAKGPAIKKVFIDMEMNASVSRHSGFLGSIGLGRVTLNLGLPLMQCLSVKQLAGVISHEYGHVANYDNAMAHWIYRVRESWIELDEMLNKEKLWIVFLGGLYNKFFSLFKIYSFTLSRYCEYQADNFAAQIVGKNNIAEALTIIEFCAEKLNKEYWAKIWEKANEMPKPAFAPYTHLKEKIRSFTIDSEKLRNMMQEKPNYKTTHPVLPKRLEALDKKIYELQISDEIASEALLGEGLENSLTFMFDKAWRYHIADKWQSIYDKHNNALAFLDGFLKRSLSTYSIEELQEAISAAHAAEKDDVIMDICNEVLKRDKENSYALLNLYGYGLVHDNRSENLVKLDELVSQYPEYIAPASYFAIRYLEENNWYEEAKIYRYRLDDWEYKKSSADEERNYIFSDDILLPHNMPEQYVQMILKILEKEPSVAKAWLVARETQYFKTTPFFPIILQKSLFSFVNRNEVKERIYNSLIKQGLGRYCRCFWLKEVKGRKSRVKKVYKALIYKK